MYQIKKKIRLVFGKKAKLESGQGPGWMPHLVLGDRTKSPEPAELCVPSAIGTFNINSGLRIISNLLLTAFAFAILMFDLI